MWLVNIRTLELESFVEGSIPPYVALSHRWTTEELNFKEVIKNRIDHSKKGYQKLWNTCRVAREYGVDYVWNDTCCIDKKSSAELSEAVNSMFNWYENAKVCVAYLEDVYCGPMYEEDFRNSVWFKRAWTLQELLAPKEVHFYDYNWAYAGSRATLHELIEEVSGIPKLILTKVWHVGTMSVADRMSWAADRVATRSEDVAYSLMGIFGIHMPPLYGEGNNAYFRLQEEILRHSADQTIFSWGIEDDTPRLLASTPADFRHIKQDLQFPTAPHSIMRTVNMGVEIEAAKIFRWELNIYGVIVATKGVAASYVLLIYKLPSADVWYRVGTKLMDVSYVYRESHNILIAWRRGDHQDPSREFRDRYGTCLVDGRSGFSIESEAKFPIKLGWLKYLNPRSLSVRDEHHCRSSGDPHREEVHFTNPSLPASLGFTCPLTDNQQFFFDLSFDFDSRPMLLVSRSELTNTAWDISLEPSRATGYLYQQRDMLKVSMDNEIGVSYSLHNPWSYDSCFATMPAELVMDDGPVWVCFRPPRSKHNSSTFWALKISTSRPDPWM